MTAATLTPLVQSPGLIDVPRPSLLRLVRVEMRKMVDTRAGKWLLAVIALLYVALAVTCILVSEPGIKDTVNVLFLEALPAGFLLPVLGVLSVTSEWSQRTALSTFTLVPPRLRTVAAKVIAAASFALLSLVLTVAIAYLTTALGAAFTDADVSWDLPVTAVATVALFQLLNVLMGLAFGMVFLSSAVAIVSLFVLPIAFTVLGSLITSFQSVAQWLDSSVALGLLVEDPAPTAVEWAHIGTASLVWIALPLILGGFRLLRSELK